MLVDQWEIELRLLRMSQSLAAAPGSSGTVAYAFQDTLERYQSMLIIVDDKHSNPPGRHGRKPPLRIFKAYAPRSRPKNSTRPRINVDDWYETTTSMVAGRTG